MLFNIHPNNLVSALSLALELSTEGLSRHHWRTALISSRIAEYISLEESQRQIVVYSALLHDIGAVSDWSEKKKLGTLKLGNEAYPHAEAGFELLKDSPQLGMLAESILYHHDRWDGDNPSGLSGAAIPLTSRIINVADRLEILLKDKVYIFEQRAEIMANIKDLSGTYLDPDLVRALQEVASQESFWLDLVNANYYQSFFRKMDSSYGRVAFNVDDILSIAEVFATIIDRTSKFTGTHSRSVASVAACLAEGKGYSVDEIKLIKIAGLFHDLGKLAVPNEILEKPGRLSDHEFSVIKQHPYYTYRILEQIDGFSQIAEWAAFHHETLDGIGYPFRIPYHSLKQGSRIVTVADVFVALSENRPYRAALKLSEIEKIMRDMADNRKIDYSIAADLFCDRNTVKDLANKVRDTEF